VNSATTTVTTEATALQVASEAEARKDWATAAAVLDLPSPSVEVRKKRAFCLSLAKDFRAALAIYDELAREQPRDPLWPYMAGYQFASLERYADAVSRYEVALSIKPDYLKATYRLAQAEHRRGREPHAQVAAARVLRLWHASEDPAFREKHRPMAGHASFLLGRAQAERDPIGAIALLEQAVALLPDDPHAHYRLGKTLRRAGRPQGAIPHLRKADRLYPRKSYQQAELARALALSGERQEAQQLLRAIEKHLRGWDAYSGAHSALLLDQPATALRFVERAHRDRACAQSPDVKALIAKLRTEVPRSDRGSFESDAHAGSSASEPSRNSARPTKTGGAAAGLVETLRADRGYGFLTDDSGTRRHFRVRGRARNVRRGDRVTFTPVDAPKGPAARDVEPLD